jgi:radical SAM/Cys-rich protein
MSSCLLEKPDSKVRLPDFARFLQSEGKRLERTLPSVLQINTGRLCNLTCIHCHVRAGPRRKEIMTADTIDRILSWLESSPIETVDLTGGTPEMIPDFRSMVRSMRSMGKRVMVRCNLTILNEPGYEWVANFHRENEVEVIASMPCYSPDNVNAQRGNGVFDSSITALQTLNSLGYGKRDDLILNLVYNPLGASLPPSQEELEQDYKRELKDHFGIVFHKLYALTNMPIARFTSYLKKRGEYEEYMQLLVESFNPGSVDGLMCRDTISVDWLGSVFDCDFNQQMKMHLGEGNQPLALWDLDLDDWLRIPIRTGKHCFGCTAGQGSSCGGAVA